MVNLGSFEMNPWLATAKHPEEPTHMVVDLDPMGGEFHHVCGAALFVREALVDRGHEPLVKTSGKTGIHVIVDLTPGFTYPRVRARVSEIGKELDAKHPKTFALEERIRSREGMIYFDYNQNGYGSTSAGTYSVRPTPTATISMPLTWDQVERSPNPAGFTIRSF